MATNQYPASPRMPMVNQPLDIYGNPISPTNVPTYAEIRNILSQPVNIAPLPTLNAPEYDPTKIGTQTFERGLEYLKPIEGIRPETQQALDVIQSQTGRGVRTAASEAQALASRRGLAGSSIEQFGTAEGIRGVTEAGRQAETNLLLENLRQNEASRMAAGQALTNRSSVEAELESQRVQLLNQQELANLQAQANRGNTQAQLELERRIQEANSVSEELASLRNMDFAREQMKVDQAIQERTLQIMQENVNISREIAEKQAKGDIFSSLIGAFGPAIASKFIGGGGGGGAPGGGGGGLLGSIFGFGGGSAGSGTGAGAGAGTGGGGLSSFIGPLGAGVAGGLLGNKVFGGSGSGMLGGREEHQYDRLAGGVIGGVVGGYYGGPLGAGLGSFAGTGVGELMGNVGERATTERITGALIGSSAGMFFGDPLMGVIGGTLGVTSGSQIKNEVSKGIEKIGSSLGIK